jgi:flavin-binding protein dodecin
MEPLEKRGDIVTVIKVIELVGQSSSSWDDAVKEAVREASKTIDHISGVEVLNWTGDVDEQGNIVDYKADVQIAFRVEGTD